MGIDLPCISSAAQATCVTHAKFAAAFLKQREIRKRERVRITDLSRIGIMHATSHAITNPGLQRKQFAQGQLPYL